MVTALWKSNPAYGSTGNGVLGSCDRPDAFSFGMLNNILGVLLDHQRFVITTHQRPDGDAIGSQIALGRFLEKLGKEVVMFNSDPVPLSLDWMPGSGAIRTGNTQANRNAMIGADVVVVVDTNSRDRLGRAVRNALHHYNGPVLLIDHHTEPESWFTWMLCDEHAAATGALIYDLICTYDADLIDVETATALYTAIITDTGSFRFAAVTSAVHRMAADLLDRGSYSPSEVYAGVYENHTPSWPPFLAMVLRSLTLLYDGVLAYVTVTPHMLKSAGIDYSEVEGLSEFAMSVAGVKATLVFTETKHGTKVSFRSKGDLCVDVWAQAYGGGGHQNASGAFLKDQSIRTAVTNVLESAPRFLGIEDINDLVLAEEDQAYFKALSSSN